MTVTQQLATTNLKKNLENFCTLVKKIYKDLVKTVPHDPLSLYNKFGGLMGIAQGATKILPKSETKIDLFQDFVAKYFSSEKMNLNHNFDAHCI